MHRCEQCSTLATLRFCDSCLEQRGVLAAVRSSYLRAIAEPPPPALHVQPATAAAAIAAAVRPDLEGWFARLPPIESIVVERTYQQRLLEQLELERYSGAA